MDNSTCSQESQLSLWQPFFVKRTLFNANLMKLKITKCFPKTQETQGNCKSVAADVCCAKMAHKTNIWGTSSIELRQSRNGALQIRHCILEVFLTQFCLTFMFRDSISGWLPLSFHKKIKQWEKLRTPVNPKQLQSTYFS